MITPKFTNTFIAVLIMLVVALSSCGNTNDPSQNDSIVQENVVLSGQITNLDKTAKSFAIGPFSISYQNINSTSLALQVNENDLVEGAFIEVTGTLKDNTLIAQALTTLNEGDAYPEGRVEITAVMGELDTTSKTFKLLSYVVDYSKARVKGVIANNERVEVEGYLSGNILIAIEVKLKNSSNTKQGFEVEGKLKELDESLKTFKVQGYTVNYSNSLIEGVLSNGVYVEVEGTLAGKLITATEIDVKDKKDSRGRDNRDGSFEIQGIVRNFSASTKTFVLHNLTVDYTNAIVEGELKNGAFVEVKGQVKDNILTASKVEVTRAGKDKNDNDKDGNIEVKGIIKNFSVSTKTFVLNSLTVDYASAIVEGELKNGAFVEVKGHVKDNILTASKVEVTQANENNKD